MTATLKITTDTQLAEHAKAIRALGKRVIGDVIEIGRRLTEAKKIAGHGNWLPWLEREFGWTDKTAERFMAVSQLAGKSDNLSNLELPVSGLYVLAKPSTPDEARAEVIERAEQGERLSVADVQNIVNKAKQPTKEERGEREFQQFAKAIRAEKKPTAEKKYTIAELEEKLRASKPRPKPEPEIVTAPPGAPDRDAEHERASAMWAAFVFAANGIVGLGSQENIALAIAGFAKRGARDEDIQVVRQATEIVKALRAKADVEYAVPSIIDASPFDAVEFTLSGRSANKAGKTDRAG